MRKIFIDDERFPTTAITLVESDMGMYKNDSDWVIVRTYDEFVNEVTKNGSPNYVSFDHDLADIDGDDEKTGFDCAKWLVDYCMDNNIMLPKYQVHSANPIGKKNINSYLGNAKNHLNI